MSKSSSSATSSTNNTKKIALVINDDFSMYHFRKDLIIALVERGHRVSVIVPNGQYVEKLRALGVTCITLPVSRFFSPLADLRFMWRLAQILRINRFDIVHNMTIKPNIFGTFAARLAGIPKVYCLVSGLGLPFTPPQGFRDRIVKSAVRFLYRISMRLVDMTWFQNPDDRNRFVELGLVSLDRTVVIRSGGINLEEFNPKSVSNDELTELRRQLSIPEGNKSAVMIAARLVWSKGVREYVEAAKNLESRLSDWNFVLLAPRDDDSSESVPADYMKAEGPGNLRAIDTFQSDVKRFVALADILVLPSYYPEGVPRTLLEGLAMGKPIVTTNSPGCRETVDDGANGYLVEPKNVQELSNRIQELAQDSNTRKAFGISSQEKARREFDKDIVVQRIIKELYRLD